MKQILSQYNITDLDKEKYNVTCPNCSVDRKKSDQKCLQVFKESDKVIWQCHHSDCEWSERQIHYLNNKGKKVDKNIVFKITDEFNTLTYNDGGRVLKVSEAIKYPYYNRDEQLWFYILRWGNGDGKVIRPLQFNGTGYEFTRPSGKYMPYRIEFFDPSKPTLIVEGEKAANFAAKIATKSNVLSWVGGSNAVDSTDWSMLENTEVTFWPDAGDAGAKAFDKFKSLVNLKELYLINTSELSDNSGIDDIGRDQITKLFTEKTLVDLDIPLTGELDPHNLQLLHKREYKFYPTGFKNIDKYVQLPNSGLVVISGRTNHGKTNFMINTALNLAKHSDLTVLYLSYEFPLAELNIRMVKCLDGTQHTSSGWEEDMFIDKSIRNMDLPAAKEYAELLSSRKLRVVDSQTSIDEVLTTMNRLQSLNKPVAVFIDYLQVIPASSDSKKSRYLELKDMVEKIRLTANKNNQLLIGGSQLTAGEKGYQDVVRESKDIEFTAALHLKVWNKLKGLEKGDKSYENIAGDFIVIVEKARQSGANGRKFGFNTVNGCDFKPVEFKDLNGENND